MYETARGVPKDLQQARYWYGKAAAQGHPKAGQALNMLK
jgi:TPR repeat protein